MTALKFGRLLEAEREEIALVILANTDGYTAEDIGAESEEDACIDVRLQVDTVSTDDINVSWSVHTGLSDYDQDHRGYWGASSIALPATLEAARELADDLIDQACDDFAQAQVSDGSPTGKYYLDPDAPLTTTEQAKLDKLSEE